MAINKKLIHFKNFSDFNSKKLSANENNTQYTLGIDGAITNGSPDILYQSICYIKDTKQQWTHGQLYDGSKSDTQLNETDPIFLASPAASITEAKKTEWDNKMDKVVLSPVATSGNYNDLTNKPTIPASVTESTVSGWGFTKNTGTITGVSANGTSVATSGVANIPAATTSKYGVTKLSSATNSTSTTLAATASAVKAAYDLANSYKGTVTGVKINGTTKNPSSGVVDLGTVITAHQDISGKQDKLVSGTNIKTINGTSILGSGDIVISGGGSSSGGNGAYSEVNHGTSDTTFILTPNTFHVWDEVASLTLDLGSETSGVANEYLFQFNSGDTATSLTLPDDIKWANELVIEPNMIYQVSILKGLASVLEWESGSAIGTFTINWGMSGTVDFNFDNGMTWQDFVDSEYNTDSLIKISGSQVFYTNIYLINSVVPTDPIINMNIYSTTYWD